MCGLLGLAGDVWKADTEAFTDLLMISQLRGVHSTGVARLTSFGNQDIKLMKRAVPAIDFLNHKKVDEVISTQSKMLMGHCRSATVGEISAGNAHPFLFRDFVGCHNGTLWNKHDLPKHTDFGTDSEAAIYAIGVLGPEEAISKMKGAWAFVWMDKRGDQKPTINFIRNDERPLAFCLAEEGKKLYWASESLMLNLALTRRQIKFDKMWVFSPNKLYSFEIPQKYDEVFSLEGCEKRRIEGKKEKTTVVHHHYPEWREDMMGIDGAPWEEPTSAVKILEGHIADKRKFPSTSVTSDTEAKDTNPPLLPKNQSPPGMAILGPVSKIPQTSGLPLRPAIQRHMNQGMTVQEIMAQARAAATTESLKATSTTSSKHKKKRPFVGFDGRMLDEKEFKKATRCGCSWCSDPVEWGDTVRFLSSDEFVCGNCMKDAEASQLVAQIVALKR